MEFNFEALINFLTTYLDKLMEAFFNIRDWWTSKNGRKNPFSEDHYPNQTEDTPVEA
jgi:hypothetical protein